MRASAVVFAAPWIFLAFLSGGFDHGRVVSAWAAERHRPAMSHSAMAGRRRTMEVGDTPRLGRVPCGANRRALPGCRPSAPRFGDLTDEVVWLSI